MNTRRSIIGFIAICYSCRRTVNENLYLSSMQGYICSWSECGAYCCENCYYDIEGDGKCELCTKGRAYRFNQLETVSPNVPQYLALLSENGIILEDINAVTYKKPIFKVIK